MLIMGKNSHSLNDEEKLVLYAIGAVDNSPLKSRIKIQKLMFSYSTYSRIFKVYCTLSHIFLAHIAKPWIMYLGIINRLGYVQTIGSNFRLTK